MKIKFNISLPCAFCFVLSFGIQFACAQYPAGSPVAINGKLKVIGPFVRNECGNKVQLRGMSTHGPQWFGNCINESSINALAIDWNADVLRIAMYIKEGGYENDPTYWKAWVDNVVDLCGKKGIYAVIDFHVHNPGNPMSYLSTAQEFWTYMATKHKDKKHVIYEICNEPNYVDWSVIKQYANIIIPLIRAIDPQTMIIVGTPTWSQDVEVAAADRLNYPNLAYTLHFYNHGVKLRIKATRALVLGLPLFVTEFGTTDPQNTVGPLIDQMEVWNAWMYDNNISWANWSFSDKAELSAALVPGSCSGNWNNTSASGTWVKSKINTADNFACNGDTLYKKVATASYGAAAIKIPGKFEAEDYDKGTNGVAYRNYVTGSSVYRTDGPEVEVAWDSTAYGYAVGNLEAGEWLNYTINAAYAGRFDVQLRFSSAVPGQMIALEVSGKNVSGGIVFVPTTGLLYQTLTIPNVILKAGIQDLRIRAVTQAPKLNYINIVPTTAVGSRFPQVVITSPSPAVAYTAPATIFLTAFAAKPGGGIAKVQFYDGNTLIGEQTKSPYTITYPNVAAGTHQIKAIAIDNSANATTSTVVPLTVGPPPATAPLGTGLKGEYFNNETLTSFPSLARIDTTVNFDWGTVLPSEAVQSKQFSVKWTGKIKPSYSEKYMFYLTSDEGARLFIDNMPVILNWNSHTSTEDTASISLTANAQYDIRIEYYNDCCGAEARLAWSSQSQKKQIVPKANLFPAPILVNPPTVTLNSPVNAATFVTPTPVHLEAVASDADGIVTRVEFYNGATLLGTATQAPYAYDWVNVKPGTYSISAKAFDNLGNTATSAAVAITAVAGANQAPSVVLTAPSASTSFSSPATISITATASDIDGTVSKVEFFNGLTKLGESLTAPYGFNWTNVLAGSYTLTAVATDNAGSATTSSVVVVTVNQVVNQAPTVSITSPSASASFSAPATVLISATAVDVDGTISKVEFFNGLTKLGESLTAPYGFNWANVLAGTYTITAKATDNTGNTSVSSPVTFAVTNLPPAISITAPTSNASFASPATIAISVVATDADGTVSKVEFFNGSTKLGESSTAPFGFSWANVGTGTYTLTAKATDNNGNVTTSAPVQISVTPAVSPVCITEANPNSANWVVRNDWSDQFNSSGVSSQASGMRISHRAWGEDRLYVIQTDTKTTVSSTKSYTISFDFNNDATMPVKNLEIGFATGAGGSGPTLAQPLTSISAGSATGSFSTKSVTVTPSASGDVYLTIGLRWSAQITSQSNVYIKNTSICAVTNARMDDEMALEESQENRTVYPFVAPNPSEDNFGIKVVGQKGTLHIAVFNLTGEAVYASEDQVGETLFYIGSDWPKGMYLLKIQSGENMWVSKLKKF